MKCKFVSYLLLMLLVVSCKEQEARRPKKQGTENFYKEVIAKNKKMNALEKKRLELWIAKDTINTYHVSKNGFWYSYVKKDTSNTYMPKKNDVVLIKYNILDIYGNTLYENKERTYKIDKEDFIPALQDGIKLMKKGETITFVIPSYSAFGIVGDGNKIKVNQPIKSTVTLKEINNQLK